MLLSLLAVRAHTLMAWLWAVLRIALSFALIAGAWIEFVARAPFTETAGVPLAWSALLYFLPVVSGCCAAYWLRRDTRGLKPSDIDSQSVLLRVEHGKGGKVVTPWRCAEDPNMPRAKPPRSGS